MKTKIIMIIIFLFSFPNGSVGSSNYLLYMIVIAPEDGRREGSKHVV
jgi:hypothetical protein